MQTFFLCRHADGRMVLSDKVEGVGATPMSAQPAEGQSAWQAVRERVEDWMYVYRPGYGYYRN
jgi:hypothetical protein